MKITITAHPNSKRPKIEKDMFCNLHVYVKEPPLEGKANHAVRVALADHFHTKKSNVFLISGEKSKIKIFEIILK
jgi:uncharacterized protein